MQDMVTRNYSEAIFSGALSPIAAVNYYLYIKRYVLTSKVINNLLILLVPSVIQLATLPQTGLIAFYFPISVGALITFPGRERPFAYGVIVISLVLTMVIVFTDFRLEIGRAHV